MNNVTARSYVTCQGVQVHLWPQGLLFDFLRGNLWPVALLEDSSANFLKDSLPATLAFDQDLSCSRGMKLFVEIAGKQVECVISDDASPAQIGRGVLAIAASPQKRAGSWPVLSLQRDDVARAVAARLLPSVAPGVGLDEVPRAVRDRAVKIAAALGDATMRRIADQAATEAVMCEFWNALDWLVTRIGVLPPRRRRRQTK